LKRHLIAHFPLSDCAKDVSYLNPRFQPYSFHQNKNRSRRHPLLSANEPSALRSRNPFSVPNLSVPNLSVHSADCSIKVRFAGLRLVQLGAGSPHWEGGGTTPLIPIPMGIHGVETDLNSQHHATTSDKSFPNSKILITYTPHLRMVEPFRPNPFSLSAFQPFSLSAFQFFSFSVPPLPP
jgi:hypothetical protein